MQHMILGFLFLSRLLSYIFITDIYRPLESEYGLMLEIIMYDVNVPTLAIALFLEMHTNV